MPRASSSASACRARSAPAGGLYALKDKITTPDVFTAHFEFDACPVTWRHRIWGAEEFDPAVSNGIFFYGEKETIFVTDDRWDVIPAGRARSARSTRPKADTGTLAHGGVPRARCMPASRPVCLIEDAFPSTATREAGHDRLSTPARRSPGTRQTEQITATRPLPRCSSASTERRGNILHKLDRRRAVAPPPASFGFGMNQPVDLRFLRLALRLAQRGRGRTSPNPMVGAALVKAGKPRPGAGTRAGESTRGNRSAAGCR